MFGPSPLHQIKIALVTARQRLEFLDLSFLGDARFIATILMCLTLITRLPFLNIVNDDEAFFGIMGWRWLHGEWPYAQSFDVKPPLLFAIYAITESIFGLSLGVLKGLEIVFVAATAILIQRAVARHVSLQTSWWAAGLYPLYSLIQSGVNCPNNVLQMPLTVAAFGFLLDGLSSETQQNQMKYAVLSGVFAGLSTLMKQTAIFEALAIFSFWIGYGYLTYRSAIEKKSAICLIKLPGLFGIGFILPWLIFGLIFFASGHFDSAYRSVILSAFKRTSGDLMSAHGSHSAAKLTYPEAGLRLFILTVPLYGLWCISLVTFFFRNKLKGIKTNSALIVISAWLISSSIGIITVKSQYWYYAYTLIPPFLILSSMGLFHFKSMYESKLLLKISLITIFIAAYPISADSVHLHIRNVYGPDDILMSQNAAQKLKRLGVEKNDNILVVGRGLYSYILTDTVPKAKYYHALHLLCDFPNPDSLSNPAPMQQALNTSPRFILVANPMVQMVCERPQARALLNKELNAHYKVVAEVDGVWDRLKIYDRNH